jgi:hypothetical protein
MDDELDTFLTTVYCLVDDIYRTEMRARKPHRRGHRAEMGDSEVLTLVLLAQWRLDRSERAMLRYARRHWRRYFPRLLSQSAFNRRVRDLAGVLCRLGPTLAEPAPGLHGKAPAYAALDGAPVPLMRRCRGRRHRCFGDEAAFGRGGSDKVWYYGVELMATITADGLWTGFVYGPADTEERWLADALFCWRQDPSQALPGPADLAPTLGPAHRHHGHRRGPTGPIAPRLGAGRASAAVSLGDLGFRGAAWRRHWAEDYGAVVLTKDDYTARPTPQDRRQARRWLSGLRQVVETGFNWLEQRFGLWYPRAHTAWGLQARLGAKIAAFNVAVSINHQLGRPKFAFLDPYA